MATACNDVVDYNDHTEDLFSSHGAPVITAIYPAGDSVAVSSGDLNEMLHIKGENLSHVKSVTFNGIAVDVRSIYAESNDAWLKIPRRIPETVTDSLVYTTEKGSCRQTFHVSIPKMAVDGLYNDFCLPGEAVQVMGENFDLFGFGDSTVTTSTIVATNEQTGYRKVIPVDSITETYMGIVIPKDCPDNSTITFSWNAPDGAKQKSIPYRMTRDLLFTDYNGDLGWWGTLFKDARTDGTDEGDPESLGYQFFHIKGTFDAWSWNSDAFGLNWNRMDASANPDDYVVKFEVRTTSGNPFYHSKWNGKDNKATGGWMMSFYSGELNQDKDAHYIFDPYVDFGFTNTYGKWRTVAIPFRDLCKKGDMPKQDMWIALNIILQPNTDPDTEASQWNVDVCFANFRIEKK